MNTLGFVIDVAFQPSSNYLVVEPIKVDGEKKSSPVYINVDYDTACAYQTFISVVSEPIVEYNSDSLQLITSVEESIWSVPTDLIDASLMD